MAILYEIIEKNKLKDYPPLPAWIKKRIDFLRKNDQETDAYFWFAHSIIFDTRTKKWTRSTND
jgi:hypothetical protein